MLLGGQGNYCASGGRERRSRLSTTSPNASSKVKSHDPSLFFNSRQREGEFFKHKCGEKGTTSLSPCAGPSGTNVSLSLFQAEMLNDPEFARNVKGLEGMLRVRERLGESSRVCVPAPSSALHSGRRDAGSVAPGSFSVGVSGGCGPPLRVSLSGGAARVFSQLPRVHFADGGVGVLSARSAENSFAFKSRLQLKNTLFFHDQAWFCM